MAFNISTITPEELQGVGVIDLPDTPNLDTASMQAKFEETARSVIIPKLNSVIDELLTNGFTKSEIIAEINERIVETGGGDMLRSTYDTNENGVVDNAERLGGELPSAYVTQTEFQSEALMQTSDITAIVKVSQLPSNPSATTLYLIPE